MVEGGGCIERPLQGHVAEAGVSREKRLWEKLLVKCVCRICDNTLYAGADARRGKGPVSGAKVTYNAVDANYTRVDMKSTSTRTCR